MTFKVNGAIISSCIPSSTSTQSTCLNVLTRQCQKHEDMHHNRHMQHTVERLAYTIVSSHMLGETYGVHTASMPLHHLACDCGVYRTFQHRSMLAGCVRVHVFVFLCMCVHVHACVWVSVCLCVCVCVCVCRVAHTYVCGTVLPDGNWLNFKSR